MSVVCSACHTENRDNAMFCMGCAGKLPAFAATAPSILESLKASSNPDRPRQPAPALLPLERPESWVRAGLLALTVTLAFMGWYAYVTRKVAPLPAATVAAQPSAPAATSAPATPPPSIPVPVAASLATGEIQVEPGTNDPPPARGMIAPPTPSVHEVAPQDRQTAPARYTASDPRRGCENLSFFLAARCEATHCERAEFTHHPRCDIVRADRRRDEARRNPTLGY